MCKPMGKFAENFNLGKHVLPPLTCIIIIIYKNTPKKSYLHKQELPGKLVSLISCCYVTSNAEDTLQDELVSSYMNNVTLKILYQHL